MSLRAATYTTAAGLTIEGLGWMTSNWPAPMDAGSPYFYALGLPLALGPAAFWAYRRHGSAAKLDRWNRKQRRQEGVASAWDIWRHAGRRAMRSRATTLRPSLADAPRMARRDVRQYAVKLADAGRFMSVWSPCEHVTGTTGGPRKGKSQALMCRIADAPGMVVATSTRRDLVEQTAAYRQLVGPVLLFNPAGIGGWASTFKWSPLAGCRRPDVATRRAAAMVGKGADAEGERWKALARQTLMVFMHAAALDGYSLRDIVRWVAEAGSRNSRAFEQISNALDRSPEKEIWKDIAAQFFTMNDRTKTSVTTTLLPALAWMSDSRASAVAEVAPGDAIDIRELLRTRATIYMLGKENGIVAPLIAALTDEIAEVARYEAELHPGGRLDPPLTLVLDEAALICPVPLDDWTADMGGRGISIHWSVQSRSDLIQRWGGPGAARIINNSASIVVFGGMKEPDDLAVWSSLAGQKIDHLRSFDADGLTSSSHERPASVLNPDVIQRLPEFEALVIRDGMLPVVGRTPRAFKRRDIQAARKRSPFEPIIETRYADDLQEDEL
jgi:type IV secretion system protein VirD4